MEKIEEKIKQFMSLPGYGDGDGSGSGYGDGSGDGYGDGYGDGSGSGSGSGDCDGSGYGDCSGYGSGSGDCDCDCDCDGSGLCTFNGRKVYYIDSLPTVIDFVIGQYAKGFVVNVDLTTSDCYIVKVGNCFAHGNTLHDALQSASDKALQNMPIEERIAKFCSEFTDYDAKVDAHRLFDWHHILTGSCLMGRKAFCRDHGLDYNNGHYSVRQFISLTQDAYNGDIIRQLKKHYE